MVLRQYGEKPVLPQGNAFAPQRRRQRDEPDVHAPVRQPAVYIVIVAVEELELHVRVERLKFLHHARQPVHRHARERRNAHRARRKAAQLRRRLVELLL